MQLFSGGTEDLNYQVNAHLITCGSEEPLIYLYISTLRSKTYLIILYLYLQLFVSGLAIGRTVSGLCPCPDPTDRSRYQNPSGPIRDLNGRVHARFSPKPTEYEVERSGTDPGFKSDTRRLPGYEIGNGTLRMMQISHFI